MKKDVFEAVKLDGFDKIDVFDLDDSRFKSYKATPRVSVALSSAIQEAIRSEVATAVKVALEAKAVPVERIKVIEREIAKPVEKIVIKELVDNTEAIMKKVEHKLRAEIDALDKSGRFGPIVVPGPIPSQSGQGGKILSTDGSNAKWIAAVGSTSSDIYTPTNVTTTRSFDATLTSLDELASVVGSLIKSLQGAGIIQ